MSRIIRTLLRRQNVIFNYANTAAINNAHTFVATGNVVSGNVVASGLIQTSSNVNAGNLIATGNIITTNTVICGNVIVTSNIITTGNVIASNSIYDLIGNLRDIPPSAQSAGYTLTIYDSGKFVNVTAASGGSAVIVPAGVFSPGQMVRIYNSGSPGNLMVRCSSTSIITPSTFALGGTANIISTGSRNVAPYGVASLLCVALNTFVIHGPGVNSAIGGT